MAIMNPVNTPLERLDVLKLEKLRSLAKARGIKKLDHESALITPVARNAVLPLSFVQQGLWLQVQLEGASDKYHIPSAFRLRGNLDRCALRQALNAIFARHEALRSTFVCVDGQPHVELLPADMDLNLVEDDLRGTPGAWEQTIKLSREEAYAPFDLAKGPMIRARLVRLDEQGYVFLLTQHHIVSDLWSMEVFAQELETLYRAFSQQQPNPLPSLTIQYPDYAAWQREWLSGERLQQQSEYWRETLADAPALLELPTDRPRPEQQSFAGGYVPIRIDRKLTGRLKELSSRYGATLFMTLLAAWAAVLSRLSGQAEVVIGTPSANRGRRETEALIGFFVNTLALRIDLSGKPRVAELLKRVRRVTLAAQDHQDMPFEQVVEVVQPPRRLDHTPLFQVLFAWQSVRGLPELPGVKMESLDISGEVAKFDLALDLREQADSVVGGLKYATSLFDKTTIQRQIGYLITLLRAMVADSTQAVYEIDLLSAEERRLLLETWNATGVDFGVEVCVHELFERQVEQTPDNVAVEYGMEALTYRELDRRANQFAHYLRKQGVGPEMVVGIWVERSVEMVVGVLGILKAGGAYLPLDGGYPEERVEYMIEDARLSLMVVGKEQEKRMPRVWVPVVVMDGEEREWEREEEGRLESGVRGENLAYVIYTSGSTGRPKGVGVSHGGLRNYIEWSKRAYWTGGEGKSPVHTPLSFDLTVTSLHGGLVAGAGVRLMKEGQEIEGLGGALGEANWGVVKLTPSHLRVMSQMERRAEGDEEGDEEGVEKRSGVLVMGGEALRWDDVSYWRRRGSGVRMINEYGPTETVVGCCVYEVEKERKGDERDDREGVPIGRPIGNAQMYILDGEMELAPVGVKGEIYIGGAGLARGYVNRAELTAERFVPNPFSKRGGERLYRTGDEGKYGEDGNIEYIGRKDEQVKIRGYRIELGEIEARLMEHGLVEEAVVAAREDGGGEKRLVAYVVKAKVEQGGTGDGKAERGELEARELSATLRAYLAGWLPEYMVPTAIVALERIPLTLNGKVDRKALPAPEGEVYVQHSYEPPQGEMEEVLANLWQELLGVKRVGRHDNFFQLGGHSLLAVRMMSHLHNNFNVRIEFSTLFNYPQLSLFAKRVLIASIEQEFDSTDFQNFVSAGNSKS
jgi:amino acid adenylation domain-containing protein